MSQLPLFEDPLPAPDPELVALSRAIPEHVRFGTSSWTFEGWKGLVYRKAYSSRRELVRESLREYARFPLFSTACVDRAYYGPLSAEDWRSLAAQVPEGFRFCTKVWNDVTTRMVDERIHPRFLDARVFLESVALPLVEGLGDKAGPLVVQLAPAPYRTEPRVFEDKLEGFLRDLPGDLHYAFELREPQLLTRRYLDVLRAHPSASHLFNLHTNMPAIGAQLAGALMGDAAVVRLMIPPGEHYADRRDAYTPFDRLVKPNLPMRRDVLRVIEETRQRGMELYVIANNKAEGCSPRTVIALVEALSRRSREAPPAR